MKATPSATPLLAAAKKHTVNWPEVLARLSQAVTGDTATGADAATALADGAVTAEQTRRKLPRDPEVAV